MLPRGLRSALPGCPTSHCPCHRSDGPGVECISQSHLVTHERRHGCACASPAAGDRCQALSKAKEAAAKRSAVACAGEAVEGPGGQIATWRPKPLAAGLFRVGAALRSCGADLGSPAAMKYSEGVSSSRRKSRKVGLLDWLQHCHYPSLQNSWPQTRHAKGCGAGITSVCGQRQLAHRARCMSWCVGTKAMQRAAQLSCTVSGSKQRH